MADTLGMICSESRLDIGAIDPRDSARIIAFEKKIAPEVKQACQSEARVAEATQKMTDAQRAAFNAGVIANQHPTPENERNRSIAQKKLKAANKELVDAKKAFETIRTRLLQAKNRILAMTGTHQVSTPVAVKFGGAAGVRATQSTTEGPQESRAASTDNVPSLRDHQVRGLNVKFQLSAQQRTGLKVSQQ